MYGTFHTKIAIFDDDIILTGANLSKDQFEMRRDRYLLVKNVKPLADFL